MGGGQPNWTRLWPAPNAPVDNIQDSYGVDAATTYPGSRARAANWKVNDVMFMYGGSQGKHHL